ncbi:MAG: cytochrome c maturation protein CcmE [Polyangiaceae bacterium]|nr:cytochrome c maturation protein CcmE [Polyangiaceae bacterium]
MSDLDEQLAQAIAESEAAEPAAVPAKASATSPRTGDDSGAAQRRRNTGLLVALTAIAAAIIAVVMSSGQAAVYSKGVDQLIADKARLTGRAVRLDGTLVSGSLRRRDSPCEYRFSLSKNGAAVPVRYAQCVVPDTFRDVPGSDVRVTVEGVLEQGGFFSAHQIMAKCPSKYEEQMRKGDRPPYPAASQAPPLGDPGRASAQQR